MAEKEYIERNELIAECERAIKSANEYRMAVVDHEFIDIVKAQYVEEDVVEVVRCKDCKHYHEYLHHTTKEPTGWGKCTSIAMDIDMMANDFCSYGERKAGNEKGAVNGSEEVPGENQEN